MVSFYMKGWSCLSCRSDYNYWLRNHYARYGECVKKHHWKILLAGLAFLGLCLLGLKSMDFEKDIIKLWIYNSTRLYNETSYILKHSSNHIDPASTETIIQVSKDNILSPEFMLEHLQLLKSVINVTVKYNAKIYTIHDFCLPIQLPKLHYIDESIKINIENFLPCQIVSPVNCFWEGSKLMTKDTRPYRTSVPIDWTIFDFYSFLKSFEYSWYKEFFEKLINDTGISRGLNTKPCIDVTDPNCPNKKAKQMDFEAIMKEGCFQIARNLYNYPKSVLVGEHNHALQSMIFLRSSADVFQTMKSNDIDWTEDEVRKVIGLWQSNVRQTVIKYNKQRPYLESVVYRNKAFQTKRIERSKFYTFTNNSLQLALDELHVDKIMLKEYIMAGVLVTLFAMIMFLWSDDFVRSHCWLAIAGILLVLTAMVAGLGMSVAVGLKFSVLTIHVIPFMMLGLGIDDVFILTGCYSRCMDYVDEVVVNPIYQTLYNCSTVITLTFLIKISILGGLVFIPVPLMRNFCGQILLITIFQTGAVVFLYPCFLYLDLMRQKSNRVDVFCCVLRESSMEQASDEEMSLPKYDSTPCKSELITSQIVFSTEFTTSPNEAAPSNVRQYVEINPVNKVLDPRTTHGNPVNKFPHLKFCQDKKSPYCWKFRYRISKTFLHIIAIVPVHITIILLTLAIVAFGVYSAINMNCGLNLESIFIKDSNEYNYINYESAEFRLNHFDVLTKEIDYVGSQDLILQLNEEIEAVTNIQLYGNGKFWLLSFILWLEKLQYHLDHDLKYHSIKPNGTWFRNASKNGILAMTLLVQDGESINYKKLINGRLVQSHQVDHNNFYLYLNVWRSVSVEYDTSPCILYPRIQSFNVDNFIPKNQSLKPNIIRMSGNNLYDSQPLQFVSCKYIYKGVNEKDDLSFVKTIRSITGKFTDKGIAAIPLGNVFSLSEQYLFIRYQIIVASIISFVCVFLVAFLTMNHLLITVLICLLLSSSLFSLFFFINLYHLPLNGTSGVMALWSGGLGIRFSLFVIVSYAENSGFESSELTGNLEDDYLCSSLAIGKQLQMKMRRAINYSPCGSILISTVLSWIFMYMTNITFIWEHFLILPMIGITQSLFNCYFLTPVLCLYLLPHTPIFSLTNKPQLRKASKATSNSGCQSSSRHCKVRSNKYNIDSDLNSVHAKLSTIPEESSSIKSSTKSHASQEDFNQASSSKTQESLQYLEQNVESCLTVQYPHISSNAHPELALKTSFKYRKPINAGK